MNYHEPFQCVDIEFVMTKSFTMYHYTCLLSKQPLPKNAQHTI